MFKANWFNVQYGQYRQVCNRTVGNAINGVPNHIDKLTDLAVFNREMARAVQMVMKSLQLWEIFVSKLEAVAVLAKRHFIAHSNDGLAVVLQPVNSAFGTLAFPWLLLSYCPPDLGETAK